MSKAIYPVVLALLVAGSAGAAAQEPDSLSWPRYRLAPDGSQITIYQVGSSRVDLQACKLEYSIVSPK